MSMASDEADDATTDTVELDPIVVVASKSPRPLSNVIGQVSVIDAEFIERYGVENVDNWRQPGCHSGRWNTNPGSFCHWQLF